MGAGAVGIFVYGAIKTGIDMTGDNLGAIPALIIFVVCMFPAIAVGRMSKPKNKDDNLR